MTTVPARRAREYGFLRSTGDWRKLVNDPKVEAVVIASPQDSHCEIALAALALKKPVLCEKPLGMSLAECRNDGRGGGKLPASPT